MSSTTPESQAQMCLPFHPASASVARGQLRCWLAGTGLDADLSHAAELVTSELVGNALRHAHPQAGGVLTVTWFLDASGLTVSVTDGGSALVPHTVDARPGAQSGRGLAIVECLASHWWTELSPECSTVHALIAVG